MQTTADLCCTFKCWSRCVVRSVIVRRGERLGCSQQQIYWPTWLHLLYLLLPSWHYFPTESCNQIQHIYSMSNNEPSSPTSQRLCKWCWYYPKHCDNIKQLMTDSCNTDQEWHWLVSFFLRADTKPKSTWSEVHVFCRTPMITWSKLEHVPVGL